MSTGRDNQAHSYTRHDRRRHGNRKRRRKNIPVVTPLYKWPGGKESFQKFADGLRNNSGLCIKAIQPLFEPFHRIEAVVEVYYTDGSPNYLEIRFEKPQAENGTWGKFYGYVFFARVAIGATTSAPAIEKLACQWGELADRGLLFAANGPELVSVVNIFGGGVNEPRPAVFWFEGNKARLAGAARILGCLELFRNRGLVPVTTAFLAGKSGIWNVSLDFMPKAEVLDEVLAAGIKPVRLELAKAIHIIVRDNDRDGIGEACILAFRLQTEYNVAADDIRICKPPNGGKGLKSGWDDADALPVGMTDLRRVENMLHALPIAKSREYNGWLTQRINYEETIRRNYVPGPKGKPALIAENAVKFLVTGVLGRVLGGLFQENQMLLGDIVTTWIPRPEELRLVEVVANETGDTPGVEGQADGDGGDAAESDDLAAYGNG